MAAESITNRRSRTKGREATSGVIPGRFALSVGRPDLPAPPGWRWTPLSEVAQLESGHTPSRRHPEYWDGGVPWIGIKDAVDHHSRVIGDTYQHVSQLGLDNSSARLLPARTVCLSRTASVGYVVVMGRPMATSQDFVNWVCGPELEADYLKYILLAERDSLLRFASGTTHQTIYYPEAKAFHALLPPVDQQRAIVRILGSLDNRIGLNRRTNETLEAMARALFKSWFDECCVTDVTASSASIEELSNRRILQVGDGYRAKNDELGLAGLPFARAGNINNGFSLEGAELLTPASVEKAGDKISRPYDVVFTSKGTVGRFAFVDPNMPRFVYSPQLCFWRSLDHSRLNPYVLFQWMQSRWFLDQVDRVKGQTDMAEYVSLRDQRRMLLTVPAERDQESIGKRLEALQRRIWSNVAESKILQTCRDTLLPRLLSGELRPSAAELPAEVVG